MGIAPRALIGLLVASVPADAAAQGAALTVFLDCRAPNCDFDHVRRETAFVNWVRDRQDADLHVLVTSQGTAGGGRAYTLALIGRGPFAARVDTLRYTSSGTDTDAEVRERLTGTIQLGLAPYAATTPLAEHLRLRYDPPAGRVAVAPAAPADDPWNFWTFQVGLEGSLDGEARERGLSLEGSVEASRTTHAVKVEFEVDAEYDRDEFELDTDSLLVSVAQDYSADVLVVWSLGARWSVGFGIDAGRSTFTNHDLRLSGGPAVEFNIYPYEQSTRQQITFRYRVEGATFDYERITVDGRTAETLARHSLAVGAAVRQPWGEVFASLEGTQYLHDPAVHRLEAFAGFEIRLFRGLSVDVSGEAGRIKDQFFLPAEGLTEEEILLRRRQRETDYVFEFNAGFTIRFGSAFANVVNPRMEGGGRRR